MCLTWVKDHPRSRGVYMLMSMPDMRVVGSSPLARGLHEQQRAGRYRRGIIPARAGFTKPPRPCSSNPRDHPRSRGVYCRLKPTRKSLRGSSPLARGLRPPDRRLHRPRRIIPARAGFTCFLSALPASAGDHPRSRGVYATLRLSNPWAWGSSPLARGLLGLVGLKTFEDRIIPARAGFT